MTVFAFHQAIPGYIDRSGATLAVTLAVGGEQPATVFMRTEPDNEELLCTMSPVRRAGDWTWYRAEVAWVEHQDATLYAFKLVWPERSCWLSASRLSAPVPPLSDAFRVSRHHPVPDWIPAQVFYQIFPDRFHSGDDQLTPETNQYEYLGELATVRRRWGERPIAEQGGIEFFGGDLPGVVQKLDYLQQTLGVTALYLNPVFSSRSNHKYDSEDYGRVDVHLGGDAALADLSAQLHQRGMRLVLDAVFNHTSVFHHWFAAAQQNDPEARARYVFTGDQPTDYVSWKGHAGLPVLDMAHLPNQHDLLTGESAVIKRWLRPPHAIDGWRMDVIHMMGHGAGAANNAETVRTIRQAIKSENSDAYLLRKQHSALQTGALVPLYAAGEIMVFARVLNDAQCLIAVNRGMACDIRVADSLVPLSCDWQHQAGEGELNYGDQGWTLSLSAESVVLWTRSAD